MTMLTDSQITEIADALEALGAELEARDWAPEMARPVVTAAASHLVSIAAMRAPVPQQAYFAPPPYPYGPEDFSQDAGTVSLQISVTGRTRDDLEKSARQHGRDFFGADAGLAVTLTSPACLTGDGRGYTCGAIVRQQEPPDTPR